MRKFMTIIALALIASTAGAKDFALRKAIAKCVESYSKLTMRNAFSRGVDKVAGGKDRQWQVSYYSFMTASRDDAMLDELIDAYETDRARKDVNFATYANGTPLSYSIAYSDRMPAIVFNSMASPATKLIIVSGSEKKGVNTICGIECTAMRTQESGGEIAMRYNIYIIERDPSMANVAHRSSMPADMGGEYDFVADTVAAEGYGDDDFTDDTLWVDDLDDSDLAPDTLYATYAVPTAPYRSEALRRMQFYSDKYIAEAQIGGGSNILKAMIFIIDEIVRKGDDVSKAEAKAILDVMIAQTPSEHEVGRAELKTAVRENGETLLNLLRHLENDRGVGSLSSTAGTFNIIGTVDEGLWDIGYYVYTSDATMEIKESEPEVISVSGRSFNYQAELQDIRHGRVRALMKDGTVCSAWIDLLFVPGETAELTVHNGTYSLEGTGFYKQYAQAPDYIDEAYSRMGYPDDLQPAAMETLRRHANEPGVFCYIFEAKYIRDAGMRKQAYDLLPKKLKESAYGVYLRRFL